MTDTIGNTLKDANRVRGRFSSYRSAKGAAGYVEPNDVGNNYDFVSNTGDSFTITPDEDGFDKIRIGAAWNNYRVKRSGLLGKFGLTKPANIDLDLGCLYEMQDGTRGCLQAFGDRYGSFSKRPYIRHSGDEQTGDSDGDDEFLLINGAKWSEIKRILIYVYIYDGVSDWAKVRPQVHIRLPNHKPVLMTLTSHFEDLDLCVIAGIENERGGIKLTSYTEYFHGHAEMDRAFGYGIPWADGSKQGNK